MPKSTQPTLRQAQEEPPLGVEIQVGEVTQSALARVANTFARTISAAGEAVYDYSGGQYGLHPLDARELRHEWKHEQKKERERTRTAAAVKVRDRSSDGRRRAWLPVVVGLVGILVGATVLAIWQRRRLQAAGIQAVALGRRAAQQVQQQRASRSIQPPPPHESLVGDYASTPASDRAMRGEMLSPSSVGGADGASSTPPPGNIGADGVSG